MLTRITAPAEVVTLAEVQDALRIGHARDASHLQNLIAAAVSYLDGPSGVLGQLIGSQQWSYTCGWFSTPLRLPIGPVITIDSIQYMDVNGDTQTVAPAAYYPFKDRKGPYVQLTPSYSWPSTMARDDAVTVTFTGGLSPVPQAIKSAIFMLVSHLNEFREDQVTEQTFPTGFGIADLIAPFRRVF